ncbi:DUF262 domain-containing protein [Roseimaritima sediminicola]|uniref:DUF262 domain-containing protein n=1 Tax=Roseimaritima sediminicola TaxID=2662066 RepID=UPI0012983E3E|nr:DUF262 domain-containing protein [Roseimaritima sediminicola]
MMNAEGMPLSQIIDTDEGAREHYHIPKYQREYTWGKHHWEQLIEDLHDNDPGYFVGSIIVVKEAQPNEHQAEVIYEVIDGQQRLTTLSLLMAAIYERLKQIEKDIDEFDDDDEEHRFRNSVASLRGKLVKRKKIKDKFASAPYGGWVEKGKANFLRVQPSTQNNNLVDYKYILGSVGLIAEPPKPSYHGVRLFAKAFKYFRSILPEDLEEILDLVAKVNQLYFVHIAVNSQADAFTLFETLNNRGEPLSATDIIKNKVLGEISKRNGDIDAAFEQWQDLIEWVDTPVLQERFLRHFYHAYRWDEAIRVDGISRVTRAKLIRAYEKIISRDPQGVFDRLREAAIRYGQLIYPEDDESGFEPAMRSKLIDLDLIQASPSYQLLLYLFSRPSSDFTEHDFLDRAVELIRRYYVRRNVTNFPSTSDLDQAHIDLIAACHAEIEHNGQLSFDFFKNKLLVKGRYRTESEFREILSGDMYDINALVTRYLLVALDETRQTREYAPDLWARNDTDRFVWTIEHVLPQKETLSDDWVNALADGDRELAQQLHWENVDRLGNLTLSGYNSRLAARFFDEKQALVENKTVLSHKVNLGYRNGLALNSMEFDFAGQRVSLATADTWNAEMIDARTEMMVDSLVKLFSFDDV